MKLNFIAPFSLAIAVACSTPSSMPPAGMHTTAQGRLVDDITRDVQGWHNMQHSDCVFSKVVASKVLEKKSDSVIESWTIEACSSKQFTYKVTIMQGPVSNFVMVGNIDGSGFKPKA